MCEEEAIKKINEIRKEYSTMDGLTEYVEAIDMILDLVNKQQKEIEGLKKDIIQVIYGGRRFGTEGMVLKDYISKDKIREIISNKRKKVLEKHDSKLSIVKRIYKKNIQVAMLDTILKELLEE